MKKKKQANEQKPNQTKNKTKTLTNQAENKYFFANVH